MKIIRHRWPRSMHSQLEAIYHSIRSFREAKANCSAGLRSFGSWKVYKYESHRFVDYMLSKGLITILDTLSVKKVMAEYFQEKLTYYVDKRRSRQTMETLLSSLGKFEYALNHYIEEHALDTARLETEGIRMEFYARSRKLLKKSSRMFTFRAFPDPIRLIEAIHDGTYQLQASLQYEGGLRAEGAGAPSNCRLKNPLTRKGLRGVGPDPVTGEPKGIISVVEKGGKETQHFVSLETYRRVEEHISVHGKLESEYSDYVEAINLAAKKTGQHAVGRGSHALKHNFVQERYYECIAHGFTHEQALQQTSLEASHYRLRETLAYTG